MIAKVANIVRRLSFFLFSASIIPVMCNAEVMMPDFRSFYFHEFYYKTILPETFGNVKIIVKEKGGAGVFNTGLLRPLARDLWLRSRILVV